MADREQARAEQGPPACGNIASQSPKINGVVALVISVSIPNPEHSVARTKPAIANLKEEPSEKMGKREADESLSLSNCFWASDDQGWQALDNTSPNRLEVIC